MDDPDGSGPPPMPIVWPPLADSQVDALIERLELAWSDGPDRGPCDLTPRQFAGIMFALFPEQFAGDPAAAEAEAAALEAARPAGRVPVDPFAFAAATVATAKRRRQRRRPYSA